MQIAVVVVTHNSKDEIPTLLRSIPECTELHSLDVIVVDSGSTDGSTDVVREVRPTATVVELGSNRGYAAGVNAGWSHADGADVMILLNPDLELGRDVIDPWVAGLDAASGGTVDSIVVPLIMDPEGVRQPSLRRRPGPLRAWAEAVLGGGLAGRTGLGELITDDAAYTLPTECAWATGAAMAISRECLDAVGAWDERYFLYAEETDFCLRANGVGFTTRLEPAAHVVHRGGEMAVSPPLYALMTWNRVRLQRKLHGPAAASLVAAGATVHELLRWIMGSRREVRRAALRVLLRPSSRSRELPPSANLAWNGAG